MSRSTYLLPTSEKAQQLLDWLGPMTEDQDSLVVVKVTMESAFKSHEPKILALAAAIRERSLF